jgi:hypothetical protein
MIVPADPVGRITELVHREAGTGREPNAVTLQIGEPKER